MTPSRECCLALPVARLVQDASGRHRRVPSVFYQFGKVLVLYAVGLAVLSVGVGIVIGKVL